MILGIELWRIVLVVVLIFLVVKRANLMAMFAKVKYNKRQYPEAMKLFQLANKVGNLSVSNKMLLGYVCLRCGELDEARKHLNLCKGMIPRGKPERNQVKNLLALVNWKEGNLPEAIEMLEEILTDGYRNTQIYQNLGIMYNLSNDAEKAVKFNEEALEYNEDDQIIRDNLADSLAIAGRLEESAKIYESLVSDDPEPRFPEAFYGYGKVLIALGKQEEGLAMIKKSLEKPFSFLSIHTKEEIEQLYLSHGGTME